MADALSEILQHITVTSSVYFQRNFYKPWAMEIANTGFAQFHVITSGSCVVTCGEQTQACATGDILLFPRSMRHTLADEPAREAIDGPTVMASFASDTPMFSEGDTATRLICGHYAYRSNILHPLISDLPDFVHVKGDHVIGESSAISVLPLILNELSAQRPGHSLIVERFAEILLIQTLRLYYAQSPQKHGFFAGLADLRLARAISHIHRHFAAPLTLADLAEAAAMSRSSFSQHFKQIARISPIEYLAKWRMITAGHYLKSTSDSIAIVAENVGYDSAISFARAFAREYGVTPSFFRSAEPCERRDF